MEDNVKKIQDLLESHPQALAPAAPELDLVDDIKLQGSILEGGISFRLLAEAIPQIVFTFYPDGSLEYYNKQWIEYTGLGDETGLQETWIARGVCHADDLLPVASAWQQSLESGKRFEIECRLKRHDGEYRWHLARALPVVDDGGNIFRWFGTCTDIDEYKHVQEENRNLVQELEQSREQLLKFFEESPVGIHWATRDGTIIWANQAELEMLGYGREDYVGHNISDFFVDKGKGAEFLSLLEKGETLRNREAQILAKDGSIRTVRIDANVLWENDEFVHSRTFTRDITPYKEFEQRKDEFLGIASHELKTPITSIRGFTQILYKKLEDLDKKAIENYLAKINAYVDVLNDLVSELLDISKIHAGKLQLHAEKFELVPMIREMIDDLRLTMDSHPITLEAEAEVSLCGDRNRIGQVVTNLLTNAGKYSNPGSPVTVRVLASEKEVVVSVTDKGFGIAQDKLKHIFERFYRVDESSGSKEGLGIGLYISAKIIERHHGKMWAESKEGGGSTFYFSLPLLDNCEQLS